ncbi:unnamed protein product [Paramecium sonneborni]|uniref:Ion transport domain-containing protein n=1 Tax=Paramecium sonneborni TaxID=65129 RepID=A0A8S1RHG9_9CILI|nr:unnamed protein product [Paramecium sonneborni]
MNSKYLITSIQRSICYLFYCLLQLIISTMLLAYVLLDDQNLQKPIVLILEALLTLTICTDIALKVITEGIAFFTAAWNIFDFCAFLSIIAFIKLQQEVYYDEIFGISLISMRYLSLTVRLVVLLKQSYFVQMMQQQRDILLFKKSRNQDHSMF